MTDDVTENRPRPEYGEYATPEEQAAAIGTVPEAMQDITPQAVVAEPELPAARRWDIIASVGLIVLGAYSTFSSIPQFANLQSTIETVYAAYGYTGAYSDPALATGVGIAVNIIQPVLLVAAMLLSARRLRAGRVAFWIPLAAGVIVTVVSGALLAAAFLADPGFLAFFEKSMGG